MRNDPNNVPSTAWGDVIRTLGPADVLAMRQLIQLFGQAFEEPEEYAGRPPADDYLRQLLGGDSFLALAAFANGESVVGGLAGYILPKFEQQRREFYLYDLAVDEAYRRRGIATALLDELCRIAQQRGIFVVFVQADHGDDPAIQLYSKYGSRSNVFHFDIDPTTGGA